MKDAIGQEIKVGDIVFYGQTSRYAEFMTAEVIELTPKTAKVRKLKGDRPPYKDPQEFRIQDFSHCVVITKLVAERTPVAWLLTTKSGYYQTYMHEFHDVALMAVERFISEPATLTPLYDR